MTQSPFNHPVPSQSGYYYAKNLTNNTEIICEVFRNGQDLVTYIDGRTAVPVGRCVFYSWGMQIPSAADLARVLSERAILDSLLSTIDEIKVQPRIREKN